MWFLEDLIFENISFCWNSWEIWALWFNIIEIISSENIVRNFMVFLAHLTYNKCTCLNEINEKYVTYYENVFPIFCILHIKVMSDMINFIFLYLQIYVELSWNSLKVEISSLIRNFRIYSRIFQFLLSVLLTWNETTKLIMLEHSLLW